MVNEESAADRERKPHTSDARQGNDAGIMHAEVVDAWCLDCMAKLRKQAEEEQLRFKNAMRQAGKQHGQGGKIAARIRDQHAARATPGAFSIDWVKYRFGHGASQTLYFSDHIPKGKGERYPKAAFSGVLHDWQRPIVYETEETFAQIRRAMRLISETRTQYRAAQKQLARVQGEDADRERY